VQQQVTVIWREMALVGEIIRHARKRIDGRDVRPHAPRQQVRGDREVFVVRADNVLADRVWIPAHHSVSGMFAS
jgi:hypothetical protein